MTKTKDPPFLLVLACRLIRLAAKNYTETVQQADLAGIYRMQLIFDLPGEIWFPNKVSRVVVDKPPSYTKTKLVKFDYKESMASLQNQVTLFWYLYSSSTGTRLGLPNQLLVKNRSWTVYSIGHFDSASRLVSKITSTCTGVVIT